MTRGPGGDTEAKRATPPSATRSRRRPRRDAELNRERILAAAASTMTREGRNVPLAAIASQAGVGVGTLYRKYADRDALLQALEYRAYGLLNQILAEIVSQDLPGLQAVREYLLRALAISDQLLLPLHGAPPLTSTDAVDARRAINHGLDRFINSGRDDGSIRARVNATDIIVFSAMTTQPLPHGPDWHRIAGRQIAIFTNGLAASGPTDLPGPPMKRPEIEKAFARNAADQQ